MANQIRLISVDRGLDPREFMLMPFGGAGPVHARACARLLGIPRMLVPPHPGFSSAFGAAVANWRVDRTRTFFGRSTCSIVPVCRAAGSPHRSGAGRAGGGRLDGEVIVLRSLDMRYAGQNYEREVPIPAGPFTAETIEIIGSVSPIPS